ncbi:MAG: hypothetical protein HKP57_05360, partial [Halobacteria archaeon]|nr:hypothetical protein [Halobacteria archaeon]
MSSDEEPRSEETRNEETKSEEPVPSALLAAHIVYGLHAFAIVVGITGAATVIGGFVGSVPSIIGV